MRVIQSCMQQKVTVTGMTFTSALYEQHYALVLLGSLRLVKYYIDNKTSYILHYI